MKRKNPLSIAVLLLSALLLLTSSLMYVFAEPVSPYLMVLPEETSDSTLTPGNDYNISIYTDYDGSDVWSWQFELTFNPAVLHGVQVRNGDLITTIKDPSAVFVAGTFDNTLGKLSLTVAYFDYSSPPAPTTSGPGTLAYVDFTVVGYGSSDIELSDNTELLDPAAFPPIIGADWHPDQIGHGYVRNKHPGDVDGDKYVGSADASILNGAYGTYEGDLLYEREADFDLDGYIGSVDAGLLNGNYGITFP
jgi:hypothetical protein